MAGKPETSSGEPKEVSQLREKLNNLWDAYKGRAASAMLGLIYPAFLGTFIVSYFTFSTTLERTQDALAWLLFVFFVLAFVETDVAKGDKYSVAVFAVDIFEVIVMTLLFMALTIVASTTTWTPATFWALLCMLFITPMLGRAFPPPYSEIVYDVLCLLAMACCVIGRFGTAGFSTCA